MPTDLRRRDDIAAAVAAYDGANPMAPLPRNAARLLAVMFPSEDVCQRSLEAIAAEGFDRKSLPATLRRLVEAGFLSRQPGSGPWCPTPTACTCRRCGHEDAAAGEGVRPWPRRAAGPQRQGPHCRLRARLGPPAPPAGPEGRSPGPRRPGRPGRPAVGVPQRPLGRLLSQLRDDRREGRLCPLAPSPRR